MLIPKTTNMLSQVLHIGCNIVTFYPWIWNKTTRQLDKGTPAHMRRYVVNRIFLQALGVMAYTRFFQSLSWEVPDRQRVMQLIWLEAYLMMTIS